MNIVIISLAVVTLAYHRTVVHGMETPVDWTYTTPDTWPGVCQTGKRQSPINVHLSKMVIDRSTPEFVFTGYDTLHAMHLFNNGKTLTGVLEEPDQKLVWLEGGGLTERYHLAQLHFHWANSDDLGAEHAIDGMHHPMEVHLVHVKGDLTIEEALKLPDGLAVLGVFFIFGEDARSFKQMESAILEDINPDPTGRHHSNVRDLHLDWLLPHNKGSWLRYNGSLTTPNCDEAVVWTLFTEPLFISKQQLSIFRSLKTTNNESLPHNYRDVQPLNGRQVYLRSLDVVCGQAKNNRRDDFIQLP